MAPTADIPTPKLALVLIRASRSLAEFLEAGLAREGIQGTDFAILEALLHKGPLAIAAIEQKLHLAEQSHFSRVFKEVVGVPPGAWQRAYRH